MVDIVRADRIHGMMPASCLFFFALEASKCNSVVEVGCWRGRTTRALYDNCPGEVYAVDTWLGSPELQCEMQTMKTYTGDNDWLWHEFCFNMADADRLKICRSTSIEAATHFGSMGKKFDMVILDAAHDYENVRKDIEAWFPLVKVGGFLFGDDYQYEDVRRAVKELFGDNHPELKNTRLWGSPRKEKYHEKSSSDSSPDLFSLCSA